MISRERRDKKKEPSSVDDKSKGRTEASGPGLMGVPPVAEFGLVGGRGESNGYVYSAL